MAVDVKFSKINIIFFYAELIDVFINLNLIFLILSFDKLVGALHFYGHRKLF